MCKKQFVFGLISLNFSLLIFGISACQPDVNLYIEREKNYSQEKKEPRRNNPQEEKELRSQEENVYIEPRRNNPQEEKEIVLELNNCNGSGTITKSKDVTKKIIHHAKMGGGFEIEPSGEANIPNIGKIGIGIKIAAMNYVTYGGEYTISEKIEAKVEPGTNIQYISRTTVFFDKGNITIYDNNFPKKYSYQFPYKLDVKVESKNLGCENQNNLQSEENQNNLQSEENQNNLQSEENQNNLQSEENQNNLQSEENQNNLQSNQCRLQEEEGHYKAFVKVGKGLNLRSEPNTDSQVLKTLIYKQKIIVLGQNEDKTWQKVCIENSILEGWVKGNNIKSF